MARKTTPKTTRNTPAKKAAETQPPAEPTNDAAPDTAVAAGDRKDDDMPLVGQIARVTHEANRAWCLCHGDDSQVDYDSAPPWQVESAVNGVRFHLENPGASASASHDNWMAEKLADGWVYGEVKDPEAKTHPCLVPFDELPEQQQAKDRLFKAIVRALKPQPPAADYVDPSIELVYPAQLVGQAEATDIPFRAYIAADACGQLLPRELVAAWPEGSLDRLVDVAARACRAFEGVNPEALYNALQFELRGEAYWPEVRGDDELGLSHLRPYADATPLQQAWVKVFASTLDHLDALHAEFPVLGTNAPANADPEAA